MGTLTKAFNEHPFLAMFLLSIWGGIFAIITAPRSK